MEDTMLSSILPACHAPSTIVQGAVGCSGLSDDRQQCQVLQNVLPSTQHAPSKAIRVQDCRLLVSVQWHSAPPSRALIFALVTLRVVTLRFALVTGYEHGRRTYCVHFQS
jgi:hypothetical protein